MDYQIITDICDLQPKWLRKHPEVQVASAIVIAEGKDETIEFFDSVVAPDEFVRIDRDLVKEKGMRVTSSMPVIRGEGANPPTVEELARKALKAGKDVLYLAVNSTISGSYNAVHCLFMELEEEFPRRKLIAMDSECASTGLNMLIRDLLTYDAKTIEEAVNFVENHRSNIAHVFSWRNLDYIGKSGKVPTLKLILGKMLGIKPLCSCEYDAEGERHLTMLGANVRSEVKLAGVIARFVAQTIADPKGVITVSHGNCAEFAKRVVNELKAILPDAEILSGSDWRVGVVIQSHGGPTSIHINYHRTPKGNNLETSTKLYRSLI